MKFFFDNHLAPKLAHGLSQMVEPENCVVHLIVTVNGKIESLK